VAPLFRSSTPPLITVLLVAPPDETISPAPLLIIVPFAVPPA
jgi:hypothetical protein